MPAEQPARASTPAGRTAFLAAFESTYLPGYDTDVAEATGHALNWRGDIDAVLGAGVRRFRYPLRWHRIEPEPGRFDWSATDAALEYLKERGADPIVDLVHHTSYPEWLRDGFRDRQFPAAYLRYAEAVAGRYPWLSSYTLFNEPFATLFLAGHEALWPPYDSGIEGFARLLRNVMPALSAASQCWSGLLPQAEHVWVDTCEHHMGTPGAQARYAALANDRRHVVLDLALGHELDLRRPFLRALDRAGGTGLLELQPIRVDVLGLDYYCHSEWWYDEQGSHSPSPHPLGFASLAEQYGNRYGLPMLLTETNLRGLPSDRASWLRYTLEQYEQAVARGVPLTGYCWFPYVDSCDWDSLLARPARRRDPVGVVSLGSGNDRVRTSFTAVWEAAAAGARSADLPAYRFQAPCDAQLRGLLPQMAHWDWQDPPEEDSVPPVRVATAKGAATMPTQPDLVVLSHLRWTWVWQRPQHLVSRFAAGRAAAGARTWFVEEPVAGDVDTPVLGQEQHDGITRVWLVVPRRAGQDDPGFDDPRARPYSGLLLELLQDQGRACRPDVLLYTPMALDVARALDPGQLYYDVMDNLAAFRDAPEGLRLRQRRLLAGADVVFAGGRSLQRDISAHRQDCHLFPSGVETAHYAASRQLRRQRGTLGPKVAGYVGVIDERIDLELLEGLAAALPDWTIRIVGPSTKIAPGALPAAPNLEYPGMVSYVQLPEVMAGFDVALMPFALNEATRSISPTKTLEYLAAGLPVVSTRVPDVVAGYTGSVRFADDARGFAAACRAVVTDSIDERDRSSAALRAEQDWDAIASHMAALMNSPEDARRDGTNAARATA